MKQKIEAAYGFKVVVLPKVRIPEFSRVSENRARFRADKLLKWQLQEKPDSISYVLGIISQDISTTKKDKNGKVKEPKWKYDDWGIFGLGYRPGKSAIISTYRLGNNQELKYERLDKIALHEIGHNLGLKHCSSEENCVMQDAAETIKTVDRVLPMLCIECSREITR